MFENPELFWLFLALPFISSLFVFDIILIKKRTKKITGSNVKVIMPYYSEGQRWIRFIFYVIAFSLIILALARPRWGLQAIDSKIKGRDILILLDVSYSMATPDAIPSRLSSAKINISEVLTSESGDRIGLMIFSGESELISPVTHDYAAVLFFLDSIYPGMLGKGGTDIGNALLAAMDAFEDEGVSNKTILLITDGENLQGNIKNTLNKLNDFGIKICTMGVGTDKGEPIPIKNSKGEIESFVKDEKGTPIISKLNDELLQSIANDTGGEYFGIISGKDSIKKSLDNLKSIEKKDQKSVKFEQKKERYDIFLTPALILLCLGFALDQGKIIKIKYNRFEWLFNKNSVFLFILFSFIFTSSSSLYSKENEANIETPKNKKMWIGKPNGGFWGNIDFNKGKYQKALENYFDALNILKKDNLAKLNYNIGNTFYKINDYKNAGQYYENAASLTKDEKLKSMIFYNQGMVEFKNQNYTVAAELFKNSLRYNEYDDNARYNYAICEVLKKEAEKNNNQPNDNKSQKNENSEDKEKNKNQQMNQNLSKDDVEKLLNALDQKEKKENRERSLQEEKQSKNRVKYW